MKRFLLITTLALVSSNLFAQTVVNPNFVEFVASPDHNATYTINQAPPTPPLVVPVVDHYDLNTIIGNPAGALAWTQGLGKPTPTSVSNIIGVAVPRFDTLAKGTYVCVIDAVGPPAAPVKGSSLPSDPFLETGPIAPPGKPVLSKK